MLLTTQCGNMIYTTQDNDNNLHFTHSYHMQEAIMGHCNQQTTGCHNKQHATNYDDIYTNR